TRLELRMADPLDSEHDRKRARNVPPRAGHGLARGGLHYVAALPRAENIPSSHGETSTGTTSADLIAAIAANWSGPVCPPVRMLLERVHASDLPKASETPDLGFAVGLDEADLAPAYVTFDTNQLLVI